LVSSGRDYQGKLKSFEHKHDKMKKFQTNIRLTRLFLGALLITCVLCSFAQAQERYMIDPNHSQIKGTIKYTVVGRYRAVFDEFEGVFVFDPKRLEASSVKLKIKTASLHSSFSKLDDIVRSKQLLDAGRFPEIIFQSTKMTQGEKEGEYFVQGNLTLHGATREISFPFEVEGPCYECEVSHVRAKGAWVINRKDFGIYWHPFLDKAGILVGNHMTVDWMVAGFEE